MRLKKSLKNKNGSSSINYVKSCCKVSYSLCLQNSYFFLISKVINLRDLTILLTYRTSKGEKYILRLNWNRIIQPDIYKMKYCQNALIYVKFNVVKLLSHVRLFVTPWTVAYKALLSMEFSRQEYWSGLPFPSPGDLPNMGIEPRSPALQVDALPSEPPGEMIFYFF